MKLYKLKHLFLLLIGLTTLISCQDDEETNFGIQILQSDEAIAPLVLFFINVNESTEFVQGDENASFTMEYVCDDPNIVSHSTFVKQVGTSDDPVLLFETTTFPSDVTVRVAEIADALGTTVSDFEVGTRFELSGTSVDNQGFIINEDNIATFVDIEATNTYNFQGLPTIEIVAPN
ncbi:hypothetical protein MG296_01205 [Flavobacteriaceae bacterium TK19130]|nr:hypothetical protein [Thermobacterium salinum]